MGSTASKKTNSERETRRKKMEEKTINTRTKITETLQLNLERRKASDQKENDSKSVNTLSIYKGDNTLNLLVMADKQLQRGGHVFVKNDYIHIFVFIQLLRGVKVSEDVHSKLARMTVHELITLIRNIIYDPEEIQKAISSTPKSNTDHRTTNGTSHIEPIDPIESNEEMKESLHEEETPPSIFDPSEPEIPYIPGKTVDEHGRARFFV